MSTAPAALLALRELRVHYRRGEKLIEAVRDVTLTLEAGEILGLVGESGCGKTQLLLSILGLSGEQARLQGSIRFRQLELLGLKPAALNRVRGAQISMIFQDPMTALNPYLTIGAQISEVRRVHCGDGARAARRRALAMLEAVHLSEPALQMRRFPHELSGGMRQRVMIAMALIAEPQVLLADEPTTALDVTVQAQILSLLRELRTRTGIAILLVTHDMGVIAEMADRVAVMYAGKIVEQAPVEQLFASPRHPYTEALQYCVPRLDAEPRVRLPSIGGAPPNPGLLPPGCAFAPRCAYRSAICGESAPPLLETASGHWSACHHQGALGKLRGTVA